LTISAVVARILRDLDTALTLAHILLVIDGEDIPAMQQCKIKLDEYSLCLH